MATDPARPKLVKTLDKAGAPAKLGSPHTPYALPGRMLISFLSSSDGHGASVVEQRGLHPEEHHREQGGQQEEFEGAPARAHVVHEPRSRARSIARPELAAHAGVGGGEEERGADDGERSGEGIGGAGMDPARPADPDAPAPAFSKPAGWPPKSSPAP